MKKEILIWLHYNTGRNTNLIADSEKICREFNESTKGDNKHCKCQNKGKAVNEFWYDWHCTYCLKPKQ